MIRRNFLGSILGGIGLGWLAPKAKAVPTPTYRFEEGDFLGRHYDLLTGITYSSSRIMPRVWQMGKGAMHIEIDGLTVCTLFFSKAQVTTTFCQEEYKNHKGQIEYQSDMREKETTLQLWNCVIPTALLKAMIAYMGDVTRRRQITLSLCSIEGTPKNPGQGWKVSNALLSVLNFSVASKDMSMTQDMQFIGQKAESSPEIWKEALMRTMPDRHSAESRFNEAIASETVIPMKVIR